MLTWALGLNRHSLRSLWMTRNNFYTKLCYSTCMIILHLTCANQKEAETISLALLQAKLVTCVRQSAVSSSYWWDGQIQHDNEVLLMMESREDKFDDIDKVVTKLHSYQEYVLTAVPVLKTTPGVHQWIDSNLT